MRAGIVAFAALFVLQIVAAQRTVSFATEDGGVVFADIYGTSQRAVVLVHGGQFNKESWAPQAKQLQAAGFEAMAIDLRGYGPSHGPGDKDPMDAQLEKDVLAAVRYLHKNGAKTISIVGGSMGGAAAGDASIVSKPGEIDRIVMLGAAPNLPADKLKSPALFIVARDDSEGGGELRLPGIRAQYEKAPQPKKLVVLKGSAHAQFLFATDQGKLVMREILAWLNGTR
ncbi:MAG TPA: alpha/beta fold hydrolase [Terriglobia bacterium]|nr:alpha/beta fold hydrolase [Terriglobia bacterium]